MNGAVKIILVGLALMAEITSRYATEAHRNERMILSREASSPWYSVNGSNIWRKFWNRSGGAWVLECENFPIQECKYEKRIYFNETGVLLQKSYSISGMPDRMSITPKYWEYEGNDTMAYQMEGYDSGLHYYNGEVTRTVLYANNETTCLIVRDDLWWLYDEQGKKEQEARFNRTKNGRNKSDGERYSCKNSKPGMPKRYLCNSRPFYELFVAGWARHKVRQECTEKYEELRGPRPAYCKSYVRGC